MYTQVTLQKNKLQLSKNTQKEVIFRLRIKMVHVILQRQIHLSKIMPKSRSDPLTDAKITWNIPFYTYLISCYKYSAINLRSKLTSHVFQLVDALLTGQTASWSPAWAVKAKIVSIILLGDVLSIFLGNLKDSFI